MSKKGVRNMIYDAIKKGDGTIRGDETKYYFQPTKHGYPNSGVDEMRVIVKSNGEIKTAFPISGSAVEKWVPELNNGQGGFI